jgi:hypothetical protein
LVATLSLIASKMTEARRSALSRTTLASVAKVPVPCTVAKQQKLPKGDGMSFVLEEKLTVMINKQKDEIEQLGQRITRLEAREEVMIAEAKGAASAAASLSMSELARRIGVLEERTQSRRLSHGWGRYC